MSNDHHITVYMFFFLSVFFFSFKLCKCHGIIISVSVLVFHKILCISSKDGKKGTKRAKKERTEKSDKKGKEEGWIEVSTDKRKVLFPKDTEINHQAVLKKFHEILAVRGKKGTDRSEQVDYFTELLEIADKHHLGAGISLKLLFNITSAIIDSSLGTDVALKPEMWRR